MTSQTQGNEPRTIGRRRLVRTTATVAWTVPIIQMAATAPAFAGTGCCDVSLSGSANWRADGLNYIDIPVTIANGCSGPLAGPLTVTLTVCGVEDITYSGAANLPAGWTQLGHGNNKLDPDSNGCYTLTFTTAQTVNGQGTIQPQFTVKTMAYVGSGHHRPVGMITAQVSSPSCSSAPVVIPIPKVG